MKLPFPRTALAFVVFALAGVSCHVSTSPDTDLDSARQRWALKHPLSYDIVVRRLCECTTDVTNAVLVSVREGSVTSRTYVSTGAQVSAQYASLFPAVEGIFLIVDDALTRNAYKLDVTYDATYGFPVSIDVDYVHQVADDELTVQLSGFVAK